MTKLGDKIRNLRKKNNWTLVELAKESGVGQSTINDIETGKAKNPKSETLAKLAMTFGISVDGLLMDFWDDKYNKDGKLAEEVREIESTFSTIERDRLDEDMKRIEKARSKMDDKQKAKMMKILETTFDDLFDE